MVRYSLASFSIAASLLFFNFAAAQEQRPPAATAPAPPQPNADQHKDADKDNTPIPPEKPVATHHEMTLDGKIAQIHRDRRQPASFAMRRTSPTAACSMSPTRSTAPMPARAPSAFSITAVRVPPLCGCTWARFRRCASRPTAPTQQPARPSSLCPMSIRCSTRPIWSSSMRRSRATHAPWAKARRRISPASIRTCAPSIASSFAT